VQQIVCSHAGKHTSPGTNAQCSMDDASLALLRSPSRPKHFKLANKSMILEKKMDSIFEILFLMGFYFL